MTQTPPFEELLALIEDRSAALSEAVAAAPDLEGRVPSCPDWSLRDLVAHLAKVQRFWAATVAAGPSDHPPAVADLPAAEPSAAGAPAAEALAELAAATETLVSALRKAGPEAGCWAWWAASGAPVTAGAVARRQVHEAAVHAYDAQLALGAPQSIPAGIALDGIAEFVAVIYGSSGPWPHDPVRIGLHAAEGTSWPLELDSAGAHLVDGTTAVEASLRGPAGELLLALYGRLPLAAVQREGDQAVLQQLVEWPPLG
ncbi:maleylpyruvate isomerase family mycothiol-dependent enzyme [Kitasatospora sp. RB6PN24]|uniref:maleylpyruvate isomerase family mycothiol-dependent enzyme n=1 Tax=Kitasatospora humi TaxID=2893891 RepID=UPI001E359732|nr:maleylpyruvate isomerase family mycothiol-dependent enzyme [Kitasatospora humi]MCC9305519.1 maleylpyruvate isomerase family mycothiol-dependent enzyme [Kitasatospora humi]